MAAGYLKKQDGTLIEIVDAKARQDIEEIKENGVGSNITKLSELTDDLGDSPIHTHSQYLTEHQDISNKANVGDSYTKAESDALRDEQIKVNGTATDKTQILVNINGEEIEIPDIGDLNELKSNTISSIEQTVTSTESNGVNEITVTKGNGETSTLEFRNGEPGHFGKLVYDDETGNMYVEDSEAEYAKKSDIPDIRIDGKSIVVDGVASLKPVTGGNQIGLIRLDAYNPFVFTNGTGTARLRNATAENMRNPQYGTGTNQAITADNYKLATKLGLCHGTYNWTPEEQEAARNRLGIYCITQSEYDSIADPKGIYIIKED